MVNHISNSTRVVPTPRVEAEHAQAPPVQPKTPPVKASAPTTDSVQLSSSAQAAMKAAAQEASETAAQTAQEARQGDRQAQRLVASHAAVKEAKR